MRAPIPPVRYQQAYTARLGPFWRALCECGWTSANLPLPGPADAGKAGELHWLLCRLNPEGRQIPLEHLLGSPENNEELAQAGGAIGYSHADVVLASWLALAKAYGADEARSMAILADVWDEVGRLPISPARTDLALELIAELARADVSGPG